MRVLFVINSQKAKFPKDLGSALSDKVSVSVFSIFGDEPVHGLARIWFILFRLRSRVSAFRKELKEFHPDVIHTHFWLSDIFGYFGSKSFSSAKLISTQHDEVRLGFFVRMLKRKALKSFRKVVAISDSVAHFTKEYFAVADDKIERIYNGVDVDKFSSATKQDASWGPVFGCIARLEKIKGIDLVLDAISGLDKAVKLLIAGDGSQKESLNSLSDELGIKDQITFLGMQNEVLEALSEMDVVVVPSRSEGLGVVILEALASKKLVIASATGGVPELIKDMETGLTFKSGNGKDLREKLSWVINNPEKARELRNAGHNWFVQNKASFDIKSTIENYLKVYER